MGKSQVCPECFRPFRRAPQPLGVVWRPVQLQFLRDLAGVVAVVASLELRSDGRAVVVLQRLVQFNECTFPPAANRPHADLEQVGNLRLRPTVVIDQTHNLAILCGKFFDLLVESAPSFEIGGVVASIGRVKRGLALFWQELRARVVCTFAVRAEEMAAQVQQLAPHLLGGQPEEGAGRCRLDGIERAQEPHDGTLEYVFDLDPAAETWVAIEFFSRELFEASLEDADQLFASRAVAALHAFQQVHHHGGLRGRIGH